jgi:hypothetical protein
MLVVSATLAFTGVAFAAGPVGASAATTRPHTAQQQRMIDCNKQATGKKGADRRTFMSSCLKGRSTAAVAAPTAKRTRQEKMKSCNADARTKALKGTERRTFMSSCLKGDAPAAS